MSYLKFNLEVDMAAASAGDMVPVLALDGGAHSLFEALEVYHGSNLLEQIREYPALYQLLLDTGEVTDGAAHARSISEGLQCRSEYFVSKENLRGSPSDCPLRNGKMVSPIVLANELKPAQLTNIDTTPAANTVGLVITGREYSDGRQSYKKKANGTTPWWNIIADTDNINTVDHETFDTVEDARINASAQKSDGETTAIPSGAQTITHTFCIPLVSGVVGAQMGKASHPSHRPPDCVQCNLPKNRD